MEKLKIYLCGKMSGLPNYDYPRFLEKGKELKLAGYEVYNPAEIVSTPEFEWVDYIRASLKLMLQCDMLLVLENGYETSKGAALEIHIAKELDMHIVTEGGQIINEGNLLKIAKSI